MKQGSDLLADEFLSRGVERSTDKHLGEARRDLQRGAVGQALEHTGRAGQGIAMLNAGEVFTPSSRLTDEENERLKRLSRRRFSVIEGGRVCEKILERADEEELLALDRKARG